MTDPDDVWTIKVGDRMRLTYTGQIVTVVELLPGDRARVRWMTAGKKQPGRRFWIRQPQERSKVVRLSSLA